ncbi:Protein translocase subunit SecD [Alphaproteobacteria bacterium]
MLRIIKWQVALIAAVCLLGVYLALPTLIPYAQGSWLAKILPNTKVNLGLDLKGGVSLLLSVDDKQYCKENLQGIVDKAKEVLKIDKVAVKSIKMSDKAIDIEIDSYGDVSSSADAMSSVLDKAVGAIENVAKEMIGRSSYQIVSSQGNVVSIKLSENFVNEVQSKLVTQSIQIVQKRIDESGTKEIDIQRQGKNNILLQVPGVYDTTTIKKILGQTAKLTFHFVDGKVSYDDIKQGKIPFGVKVLPLEVEDKMDVSTKEGTKKAKRNLLIPVQVRPVMTGEVLTDAQPIAQMGSYSVQFKLNNWGAKIFAEATRNNVGKALAIVLDDKAISAPVIREPILTGSGVISGNFHNEAAIELALLLRSGALPAKLTVIEERTVGPTLGQASINAGAKAVVMGGIAVVIFMIIFYGLWGIFADIALAFNLLLIVAILGAIGGTLTMPGLAGIALTLGMAVDANVLILERMREEHRKGGKSIPAIIENSYKLALTTIVDSNITTVAAAVILYIFGSGPVRGFAVTLTIGILCSMFTAVVLNKMLVAIWYRLIRPQKLLL